MQKVLNAITEKWTNLMENSQKTAEETNIPVTEAFENGYAAAARAILADLKILGAIMCTDTK